MHEIENSFVVSHYFAIHFLLVPRNSAPMLLSYWNGAAACSTLGCNMT